MFFIVRYLPTLTANLPRFTDRIKLWKRNESLSGSLKGWHGGQPTTTGE